MKIQGYLDKLSIQLHEYTGIHCVAHTIRLFVCNVYHIYLILGSYSEIIGVASFFLIKEFLDYQPYEPRIL